MEPHMGRYFEITTTPLRNASGEMAGCVQVMHDVTERKSLEEQLRQAHKMEAVGRLAGGVAHDFNNMLGVILGYTEMMSGALPPDEQRLQGYCEEVHKAGQRASTLTRQLLAFSRRQVLQPKVVALNAVVQESEGMLRRLIGEDIEVLIDLAPDLWLVKVDAGQMNQILLNLAANARDAMPGGGRLALRTGNVTLDESYQRLHRVVAPGEYVLLSVSDTGVGMDDQTRLHIFEPFFTTKEPGKGTGLGLATVYGIVKQSGGFIWVYSEPGHGTTFKIYLPRTLEDASPAVVLAARPRMATGNETILLVEDEEAMRAMIRQLLEQGGYRVLEANNGRLALELAQQYAGPIHLLISDVVMPEMGGPQLAEHMAQLRPQTRVLFLSGYADRAFEHLGIAPGAALLEKPFNGGGLLQKVREILGGSAPAANG
jgi:signal transduction histidine kinase